MNIEYHLVFNRTFLDPKGLQLRNKIFELWKKEWERVYAQQGSSHSPTADDFARHDVFSALVFQGRVLGFIAHSFLDFDNRAVHHCDYFTMFGESYADALLALGIRRVMTHESHIIDPDFHRNEWRLPLSRILIRTNSYLFDESSAGAIMAVSRKDNSVSKNLEMIGFRLIEADKNCRGFLCDLRALIRGEHLNDFDDVANLFSRRLWDERQIHWGEEYCDFTKIVSLEKAAA